VVGREGLQLQRVGTELGCGVNEFKGAAQISVVVAPDFDP